MTFDPPYAISQHYANPRFIRALDGTQPEGAPDALRMKADWPDGSVVFIEWPLDQSDYVAISCDLLEQSPNLIEAMPWPMQRVWDDPFAACAVFRRMVVPQVGDKVWFSTTASGRWEPAREITVTIVGTDTVALDDSGNSLHLSLLGRTEADAWLACLFDLRVRHATAVDALSRLYAT